MEVVCTWIDIMQHDARTESSRSQMLEGDFSHGEEMRPDIDCVRVRGETGCPIAGREAEGARRPMRARLQQAEMTGRGAGSTPVTNAMHKVWAGEWVRAPRTAFPL